jgi:hypothetical protein
MSSTTRDWVYSRRMHAPSKNGARFLKRVCLFCLSTGATPRISFDISSSTPYLVTTLRKKRNVSATSLISWHPMGTVSQYSNQVQTGIDRILPIRSSIATFHHPAICATTCCPCLACFSSCCYGSVSHPEATEASILRPSNTFFDRCPCDQPAQTTGGLGGLGGRSAPGSV